MCVCHLNLVKYIGSYKKIFFNRSEVGPGICLEYSRDSGTETTRATFCESLRKSQSPDRDLGKVIVIYLCWEKVEFEFHFDILIQISKVP